MFDVRCSPSPFPSLRDTYSAASRFLAAAGPLPEAELRPLLEPVLRSATSPGLAPVRAWTLRLWRDRALPETPLTRHAEARLGQLGIPARTLARRPSQPVEPPPTNGTPTSATPTSGERNQP